MCDAQPQTLRRKAHLAFTAVLRKSSRHVVFGCTSRRPDHVTGPTDRRGTRWTLTSLGGVSGRLNSLGGLTHALSFPPARLNSAGIRCPQPLLLRLHVLVMTFIGTNSWAAPRLKDAVLSAEKLGALYVEVSAFLAAATGETFCSTQFFLWFFLLSGM